MQALLKHALVRLETVMDKNELSDLQQTYRRQAAGGRWLQLRKRLESLEKSTRISESRDAAFLADQIKRIENEKSAIKEEMAALEQELGQEEIARIQGIPPLCWCGTPMVRASQWTVEKQQEEDRQLLSEVEGLLAGRKDQIH